MIVLDTSIISTFALIGAMDLLYALFPNDDLGVTPAVYTELGVGVGVQRWTASTRGLFPPSLPSPAPGGRGQTARTSQGKSEN